MQRTQSDVNPQTPDKDGAEKNDERKKQVIRENRVAQNPKGEWRKFLEVVPQDAERIQEQSVYFGSIYESRKKLYWLTSGEDDWIPANENAVKNYLSVERNVPAAEMKGAVNFVTRYANVEYATQLAGYPKGIYAFDDGVRVLVNGQPKIVSPVKGEWNTIERLLVFASFFFQHPRWCNANTRVTTTWSNPTTTGVMTSQVAQATREKLKYYLGFEQLKPT